MISVRVPLCPIQSLSSTNSIRPSSGPGFLPALLPIEEDRALEAPALDQPSSPKAGLFAKLAIELELRLTCSAETKAKAALAKAVQADHDARLTGDAVKQAKARSKLAYAADKHKRLLAEKQQLVHVAAQLA